MCFALPRHLPKSYEIVMTFSGLESEEQSKNGCDFVAHPGRENRKKKTLGVLPHRHRIIWRRQVPTTTTKQNAHSTGPDKKKSENMVLVRCFVISPSCTAAEGGERCSFPCQSISPNDAWAPRHC